MGIGEALIKARIMRRLTQKQMAEQQVQRYEAMLYRGVAAERLQEVADTLRLRVREVFTLEQNRRAGDVFPYINRSENRPAGQWRREVH